MTNDEQTRPPTEATEVEGGVAPATDGDLLVDENAKTASVAATGVDDSDVDPPSPSGRRWSVWPRSRAAVVVSAVIAVLAVLVGVFAYLYLEADDAKSVLENDAAQRAAAAEAASDYTTKSLTYSYQNTDAFFAAVKENADEALTKRYDEVRPTLTQIMQQAQVQASGRVLATSVTGDTDGEYTVMVFASQKTQNVQNPQPSELPTLLKVIVSKTAGGWQIQDYGPAE
ncbi:Mce-associated membrane protein [Williamsia limnetica]|uniref:Mce-associated membrane protein n=1 Tax=Williamsia limnetica TaxID=882452 RepID=A0A318RPH9_WILLI|nr:Mce-associated membrane protein [Williamsia limnetica]